MTMRRFALPLATAAILTAACSGNPQQTDEPAAPSLSFEEEAASRAALTVYEASQDLVRRAWADPAEDWTTELEQVTDDPYRSALLADLAAGRDDAAAYTSDLTTAAGPTVVDVDLAAGVINVTDCLDDGTAIDAEVHRAADGRWLVADYNPQPDRPC